MHTLFVALSALLILSVPAFAKESATFQKWTFARDVSNGEESLSIYADSESKDARGGLLIMRVPGQCEAPGLLVLAMTKKKGHTSDWLEGMLRVDEKQTHTFKYRVTFPKENGMALTILKDIENGGDLGEEMRQGNYLRVRLSINNADSIMRVPLAGFAEASAKQIEVCSKSQAAGKKSSRENAGLGEKKEKKKEGGFGTGFFINAEGYVITNYHVVEGGTKIVCEYQNNKYPAKVVKVDQINDLALLKVEVTPKTFLNFRGTKPIKTGEEVVAIGFPLYGMVSTHPNITTGNVSSAVGLGDDSRLLQTTAPVQPGNSGGPLLDSSGNVLGVVVSKLNALAVVKAIGDIPQNINFAIRTPIVKSFLEINEVAYETADSAQDMKVVDIGDKTLPGVVLVIASPQKEKE